MKLKAIWILPALAALAIAFILVSGLVAVSGGRGGLIRTKLKLGALLLGLTGFFGSGCGTTQVTCYAPVPVDLFHFPASDSLGWDAELDLAQGNTLSGSLASGRYSAYAFRLLDATDSEVQRGEVLADDGEFGEQEEEISLAIDESLPVGAYSLRVHHGPPAAVAQGNLLWTLRLGLVRSSQ